MGRRRARHRVFNGRAQVADSRFPVLTALAAPAADDLTYVVDVSDTTDHASGTSKKLTSKDTGRPLTQMATTQSGQMAT
jgi:hypothetical protein